MSHGRGSLRSGKTEPGAGSHVDIVPELDWDTGA